MLDVQPSSSANRELAAETVATYVRRIQIGSDHFTPLAATFHEALGRLRRGLFDRGSRIMAATKAPIPRSQSGWPGTPRRGSVAAA